MKYLGVIGAAACAAAAARGGIVGVALGTEAPPAVLGGVGMWAFAENDGIESFEDVASLPSPLGGEVVFDPKVSARRVGETWATWSHGYAGDVYYSDGKTHRTLTLPENTVAFILYAEPGAFAVHAITATADDGATVSQDVDGKGGASGYGFYATGAGTIRTITLDCAVDYAIGEFSIGWERRCRADCTGDGEWDINDFVCFQRAWRAKEAFGDFDGSGTFTVNDFVAFQAAWREEKGAGCG